MYKILRKKFLTPAICLMDVLAPRVAQSAQPGQFLIVRAGEKNERIPLTICDYNREEGSVTIVTQLVGASTRIICSYEAGESFADVVGPLGQPSEFIHLSPEELSRSRYLFIAGGLGTAPVYPQVKYLHQAGAKVDVIIGARNKDLVILEEEMRAVCDHLYICTDDGSYGEKGLVTDIMGRLLDSGEKYDQAVAIGPMIMMKFVTLKGRQYGIPLIVSLNTLMVDGTGMCGVQCLRRGLRGGYAPSGYVPRHREGKGPPVSHRTASITTSGGYTMANKIPRVPVREQDPAVRAHNFQEVCYGYNEQEAVLEASRCLNCKKPRCVEACPVSIQIPAFISKVAAGDIREAARIISQDSSLPAVCGRVCPQETQCEGSCILGVKGEPVAIGKLERFVADWSRHNGVRFADKAPANGIKVAVVGSGPAGLACASDLARWGYEVTVFEVLHKAGGVLQYGIPEFRLPKEEVVEYEVENVRRLGVKIETDVVVGRTVTVDDLFDKEGFKAVFIGSGAGLPKFMGIPGENLNGVFSANEFLTRNNLMHGYDPTYDTPVFSGRRSVIVGGGNVAMDAARTALRLGSQVTVVYRRTEKELPARVEEVHHAKEEGIEFRLLTNPVEILGDEKGWVRGIRCIRMELGEPDESGRRSPVPVPGSEFEIETDTVIMSLGTSPNPMIARSTPGLETNRRGCLIADEDGATTRPMVFAGGDAVTGAATVILAMGAGRRAAAAIHKALQSEK